MYFLRAKMHLNRHPTNSAKALKTSLSNNKYYKTKIIDRLSTNNLTNTENTCGCYLFGT